MEEEHSLRDARLPYVRAALGVTTAFGAFELAMAFRAGGSRALVVDSWHQGVHFVTFTLMVWSIARAQRLPPDLPAIHEAIDRTAARRIGLLMLLSGVGLGLEAFLALYRPRLDLVDGWLTFGTGGAGALVAWTCYRLLRRAGRGPMLAGGRLDAVVDALGSLLAAGAGVIAALTRRTDVDAAAALASAAILTASGSWQTWKSRPTGRWRHRRPSPAAAIARSAFSARHRRGRPGRHSLPHS